MFKRKKENMKRKSLHQNTMLALVICTTSLTSQAEPSIPTEAMISEWWQKQSDEKLSFADTPKEIHLRGGEVAYLQAVMIFDRGRNDVDHVIMIRPTLAEVRIVGSPLARDIAIMDLDNDGISEVSANAAGSGQGSNSGIFSISQFSEWTPIVLHTAEYSDNAGEWGHKDYRFHEKSINWTFKDIDGDGAKDLIEVVTIRQGRNKREPASTSQKFIYLFKDNSLVRKVKWEAEKKQPSQ